MGRGRFEEYVREAGTNKFFFSPSPRVLPEHLLAFFVTRVVHRALEGSLKGTSPNASRVDAVQGILLERTKTFVLQPPLVHDTGLGESWSPGLICQQNIGVLHGVYLVFFGCRRLTRFHVAF